MRVSRVLQAGLKSVCLEQAAGPALISGAFTDFMAQNFDALTLIGFSARDIEELPVGELMERMEAWVAANVPA